jgi:hypothetical protein
VEIDPENSNCSTFEQTSYPELPCGCQVSETESAPDLPSRSLDLRLCDRDRDRRRDFRDRDRRRDFRDRDRRRDFRDRDRRPLEAARFLVSFSGLFSVLKIREPRISKGDRNSLTGSSPGFVFGSLGVKTHGMAKLKFHGVLLSPAHTVNIKYISYNIAELQDTS